jgi:hypothetical protein
MREITLPAPAPVEAPEPGAGPGPGPAAVAPAAPDVDLDQLAHRLYDRIRWRLRNELRLDRERAGLGAGVRR